MQGDLDFSCSEYTLANHGGPKHYSQNTKISRENVRYLSSISFDSNSFYVSDQNQSLIPALEILSVALKCSKVPTIG